jgi:hypothetical protein
VPPGIGCGIWYASQSLRSPPRTTTAKQPFDLSCSRNRAWNPPTSSSLAEEKRLRSLLLSTAGVSGTKIGRY